MKKSVTFFLLLAALFLGACQPKFETGQWVSIFDGETLNGWKKSAENP
ncbi:MAG TPA: DUF1080 domain-containing protein, partial [Mariniphaga anaerophila]|nr:DUF1080 domain-containing protein [Mariniphaga anaerophila]